MDVYTTPKIYILEDEQELAENIKDIILTEDYEVVGMQSDGGKAILEIIENKPDLVLIDVKLAGKKNGIQVGTEIKRKLKTKIIYITAFSDEEILNEIALTNFDSYILKPFSKQTLISNIKLSLIKTENDLKSPSHIKIRDKGMIIPINEEEIIFAKAEGLYTRIYTSTKFYMLREILKEVEEKLDPNDFLRVHKSYLVNVNQIVAYNSKEIKISNYSIPLRRGFIKVLEERLLSKQKEL
ncbi:LytR/AlgR family response regulator transcription factor [Algoriphagus marincola]|uniref:LytR/AlgR family response regulator transcription factor n=1 Tax=Algoriphagus marincola TaxID=264027 RepID=UPI00041AEF44|nr:response regulator transcription factor [Algoriphagus marincola]